MSDTTYTDFQAPAVNAAWLNDVNVAVYRALSQHGIPPATPADVLANIGAVSSLYYSATDGSNKVGFLPAGLGALARTAQDKLRDLPSSLDFVVDLTGVTDCTAGLQALITQAGQLYDADWYALGSYAAPRVVHLSGGVHKVTGKILVPRGVIIEGDNATLVGTGYTLTDNVCFESAYFNAGTLTANIGTAAETHRLQNTQFKNIKFVNFKTGLNLFNFNEGCAVTGCAFYNVRQAWIADRSFYAKFTDNGSRGSAGGATEPAFDFRNYVNVENISYNFCADRFLGFQFSGAVNGLALVGNTAENGTNGMKFTGEVNPLNIDSNYFESLTGNALDFTTAAAHRAVTIDNNWFNNITGWAMIGVQMIGGRVGLGNYFLATPNKVSFADVTSTITIEIPRDRYSDAASTLPTTTAGYTLSSSARVISPATVYSNVSGADVVRNKTNVGSILDLPYFGVASHVGGQVAFCATSLSGNGASVSLYIDTRIAWDQYAAGFYSIALTDNGGTSYTNGRWWANNLVCTSDSSGKPISISNNGGYVRLTLTTVNAPSGGYTCEGIVRLY